MSTSPGQQFADWNRFANSNGIGSAIKTGLTAYGMQKSGLTDWLNSLNAKPMANGPTGVQPGVAPGGTQIEGAIGNNPSAYQPVIPVANASMPVSSALPKSTIQQTPSDNIKSLWDHTQQSLPSDTTDVYKSEDINPQASRDIPVSFNNNSSMPIAQIPQMPQSSGVGKMLASMMFA